MGRDAALRNQAIRRSQSIFLNVNKVALQIEAILSDIQDDFDDLFPQLEKHLRSDLCNMLMAFMVQLNDIGNEALIDHNAAQEYRDKAFAAESATEAKHNAKMSGWHMALVQEKYERAYAIGRAAKLAVESIRKSLREEPTPGSRELGIARERVHYTPQRARSSSPVRRSLSQPLLE